jgi:hypothetical protein
MIRRSTRNLVLALIVICLAAALFIWLTNPPPTPSLAQAPTPITESPSSARVEQPNVGNAQAPPANRAAEHLLRLRIRCAVSLVSSIMMFTWRFSAKNRHPAPFQQRGIRAPLTIEIAISKALKTCDIVYPTDKLIRVFARRTTCSGRAMRVVATFKELTTY